MECFVCIQIKVNQGKKISHKNFFCHVTLSYRLNLIGLSAVMLYNMSCLLQSVRICFVMKCTTAAIAQARHATKVNQLYSELSMYYIYVHFISTIA